ncbi:MAG: flagellar protein FlaG [Rhodocyclaceae bacterium]|nr:flagellar protein FlaG [Rhodocyclaceae bacterium]
MAIQSIASNPIPPAEFTRAAGSGVTRAQTPEAKDATGTEALQQTAPAAPPSEQQVNQALDDVRNALKPVAQNLLFSLDSDTGKTVIKIVDASTDEVIKQIPSEEILAISKALDKLQGLLVKQEV